MANLEKLESLFVDALRRYEAEVQSGVYESRYVDRHTRAEILQDLKAEIAEFKEKWNEAVGEE